MSDFANGLLTWTAKAGFTDWLSLASDFVGVGAIGWIGFTGFAWRWPIIRRFVRRPDLNGTWHGTLRSNWVNPATGLGVDPFEVAFVVHQSHGSISLTMLSAESRSITVTATLSEDAPGEWAVVAAYRNEPDLRARERSPIHLGTFKLRVVGSGSRRLAGHYWTDRSTAGEIDVNLLKREYVNDFKAVRQLAGTDRSHRSR